MRTSPAALGTAALLAFLVPAGRGQSAPQSTFRTGIDLVRIDVTVLDHNRRPVRGLTGDDFTLLMDGKPQPIEPLRSFASTRAARSPLFRSR